MCTHGLVVLSLFVLIWYCQAQEGTNITSQNLTNDLNTTSAKDNTTAEGERLDVAANSSMPSPSEINSELDVASRAIPSSFRSLIKKAVDECINSGDSSDCTWENDCEIIGSHEKVKREISDSTCCCACHRETKCKAVHYISDKGTCVFHEEISSKSKSTSDCVTEFIK